MSINKKYQQQQQLQSLSMSQKRKLEIEIESEEYDDDFHEQDPGQQFIRNPRDDDHDTPVLNRNLSQNQQQQPVEKQLEGIRRPNIQNFRSEGQRPRAGTRKQNNSRQPRECKCKRFFKGIDDEEYGEELGSRGPPYYNHEDEDDFDRAVEDQPLRQSDLNRPQKRRRGKGDDPDYDDLDDEGNEKLDPDYNPLIGKTLTVLQFIEDNVNQKEFIQSFGKLKLMLAAVLFFSLFLTIFGYVSFSVTKVPLFLWIATTCLILNTVWLVGIISIFKVEHDLKQQYYTNLSGTLGFEALFVFFNLSAILMVALIFMGTYAFLSMKRELAVIESIYYSKEEWNRVYGADMTLESMQNLTSTLFFVASSTCFLIVFFLLFVFAKSLGIGETQTHNRLSTFFLTFNSFLMPLIAMIFIYMTIFANAHVATLPIVGNQFLPTALTGSIYGIAAIAVVIILLGYAAALSEQKIALETYSAITGLIAIGVLIQAALLTSYALKFDDYYSQNWGKISTYVDKRYFTISQMGCYGGKYLQNQNSTNFYNLKCDSKEEIAYMWEDEYEKNIQDQSVRYGCINMGCKAPFGSWVSSRLKQAALAGYTLFAVCMFCLGMSISLWRKISNGQERIMWHNRSVEGVLGSLKVVILITMLFVCIFAVPNSPQTFSYAEQYPEDIRNQPAATNAIILTPELTVPNKQWFTVYGLQISEDQSQCKPDCNPLTYYIELTTSQGSLRLSDGYKEAQSQLRKDKDTKGLKFNSTNGMQASGSYFMGFKGELLEANLALQYLEFGPNCPFDKGLQISILLQASGADNKPASGQKVAMAAGEGIDVRGYGIFTVVNSKFDQNLADQTKSIKYTGRVKDLSDQALLESVQVKATYGAYKCPERVSTTDKNGSYVFEFPVFLSNQPYEVSLVFSKTNYQNTVQIVTLGGIVIDYEKYLEVYLVRTNQNIMTVYKTQVLDALTFKPNQESTITLYQGGNKTNIANQEPVAKGIANDIGKVEYYNLKPGQYMVQAQDKDTKYVPFLDSHLYLMGDDASSKQQQRYLVLNDAKAKDYGARVVLTWSTLSQKATTTVRDLDLFVDFKVNNNFVCSVGFYNPLCQGLMGNFDSQNAQQQVANAETLTFYTVGEYKYIVYVGEYLDKTSLNQPTIMDTNARLDLYLMGQSTSIPGPAAQFTVPYQKTSKSQTTSKPYRYWAAFCVEGSLSFNKITSLNVLSNERPTLELCKVTETKK